MELSEMLLLFDADNPCWTEDLADLAGKDPALLLLLVQEGFAEKNGSIYSLTPSGREAFLREASECFLSAHPGSCPEAPEKSLLRTRLRLLLDKKHLQRWGLKEYLFHPSFPIPSLTKDELFSLCCGLKWLWPSTPAVQRLRREYPETGLAARKNPELPAGTLTEWFESLAEKPDWFKPDFLYLSRYDYEAYTSFSPPPDDVWGLLNTDRFFFFKAPEPEEKNLEWFLEVAGRFHLCLEVLRRLVLPGHMDFDSWDQGAVNWLLFLFEKEKDARKCVSLLAPLGQDLVLPALPMDIWVLSFEALSSFPEKAESIHDLLPEIAYPIARAE